MDFDQLFPDNREDGSSTVRQCQLVMLRMLKIFDYLCNKYEIKYFLIGGSLLGAVRHNGFIPWDDDLDVGMTRNEYEKFLKLALPDLPKEIFFQNPQTDIYYPSTFNVDARLRDKYSSYIHIDEKKRKWHQGLQLDIFVHDRSYLPHNFFIITQNKLLKLLKDNLKRAKVLKLISKYSPFPLVYSSNYLHYYSELKLGTYIKESEFSKLIKIKFEDMEVYIPQGYDSYLKRQYGNYMQLPPIEKRVSPHNVKADAFIPCEHNEIMNWEKKTLINER
jgi:lipopolysaccharide cholinephosphotransferase